jgi:hypothetical protein
MEAVVTIEDDALSPLSLGTCPALVLSDTVLWASTGPKDQGLAEGGSQCWSKIT